MNKTLYVSDLDGTLMRNDERLSTETYGDHHGYHYDTDVPDQGRSKKLDFLH